MRGLGKSILGKKIIAAIGAVLMVTTSGCGNTGLQENESTEVIFEPASIDDLNFESPEPEIVIPDLERALPSDVGIHDECIALIEDIIETDIEYGFTSAQLSIIKDDKLIYENAWGKTCSYNKDGSVKEDSAPVTTDTLYDLASVSKMFGVNYALQKMVTDGELDINEKIVDVLGPEFADNTIDIQYANGTGVDLDTQKQWKSELTVADLLKHRGGFPADPRYGNPNVDQASQEYDPAYENILFSAHEAGETAKAQTYECICKTPLLYEPDTKTVYSDVDYMILGYVVEKKSGVDLDTYLKENFCEPLGLTHMTYNPLQHGFSRDDCAATELNGNTRDGYINYEGIRTETIQGEVHDEKAYYCMGGVSGHAGLFSNATDLARLANVMLTGKCGDMQFFSQEVIDEFTAPAASDNQKWGLGWWRQGEMERTKYFGTKACPETFGHQGWTGTLVMIDPEKKVVIAILTNKINSPVTSKKSNPNKFNGNWYTTAGLGFVAEILYIGMDEDRDVRDDLISCVEGLIESSEENIKKSMSEDHPERKDLAAKQAVLEHLQQLIK